MKVVYTLLFVMLAFCSCSNTYTRMLKSEDYDFKYEAGKQYFAEGKYSKAIPLLQEVVTMNKGTEKGEENLYMLGMAEFAMGDNESAAEYFKKYTTSYPRGTYIEEAYYNHAYALYKSSPEIMLDQTPTMYSIKAFQEFIDLFPEAKLKDAAQDKLFELQDRLVLKEYNNAKLYFNLGSYFGNCTNGGNNYESCVVTAQNALKDYPYTSYRENFSILIMKSKYQLAKESVEEKKLDRYREAEDECYGFLNEFPDSKEKDTALKYIAHCKKYTKD